MSIGGPNGVVPAGGAASARTALLHDYLLVVRGAERTFAAMAGIWPEAPVYTLLHDRDAVDGAFADRRIRTSALNRLRLRQSSFRRFLPVFPTAAERLLGDGDGHDLVISSSSAFAHGVRVPPSAMHVCYCHTPFRYAWHDYARTMADAAWYMRPALGRTLRRIRDWDRDAAQRTTHYIANSQLTRERIRDFWGRDATVVNPPVNTDRFHIDEPGDYFLVVAELTRHKRVEVALEAAVRTGQPIKVVGLGPDFARLSRMYGSTAQFLGRVPDESLPGLYARCKALIVPNVEEFGIAAVEAQASGRPVLGTSVGGTSETVVDGETGILVTPENVGGLAEAMTQVDFDSFSPERIREHALRFSIAAFQASLRREVSRLMGVPEPDAEAHEPTQLFSAA